MDFLNSHAAHLPYTLFINFHQNPCLPSGMLFVKPNVRESISSPWMFPANGLHARPFPRDGVPNGLHANDNFHFPRPSRHLSKYDWGREVPALRKRLPWVAL